MKYLSSKEVEKPKDAGTQPGKYVNGKDAWENQNENHNFSGKADAGGYRFIYLQHISGFYGENGSPDAMDPRPVL